MRWVVLALIALSLPLFVAWLSANRSKRDWAVLVIGALLFFVGTLRIETPLIVWPVWPGTSKGIVLSPVDTLALALILTRNGGFDRLPFRLLIFLYSIPIILSAAFASIPLATTFTVFQLARMLLLFTAIAGELTRPSAVRSLLSGLSLGLMVQAGFVVEQKLAGVVQAPGTLDHQNILGIMVELSMLPLLAAVLEGDRRKLSYLGIAAGLVIVAGGGSRATMGIIGAAVVVLTLLSVIRRMTPRKLQVMGLGVLAIVVIVPLGVATLKERFGNTSVLSEEEQRPAFERAARAMAADHPFGVGANLFAQINNADGYANKANIAWYGGNRGVPVHNAYLLARAETGWLGQAMLLAMMLIPIATGWRLAFGDRKDFAGGIALGSVVAISAVAIHSNFEFAWHLQPPQALFFINLAIIAGTVRAQKLGRATRRRAAREEARQQETERDVPLELPGAPRAAG